MISGTLRHEGAMVAEDQEPLARAFGQVEHQANRPARHSGGATVDQVSRRFAGPPAPRPALRGPPNFARRSSFA